jgi:hypothetical protein
VALRRAESERRLSLFDDAVSEQTLADRLADIWEGLGATGSATCPVCGGVMVAGARADGAPRAGCCGGCGSELS